MATRVAQLMAWWDPARYQLHLDKQKGFGSAVAYYRHLLDHADARCRFWFALADDLPENVAFAADVSSMSGVR